MRLEAAVALLGAGKLGEAFLRGVLDSGVLRASGIRVSVRSPDRARQLRKRYAVEVFAADNRRALRGASVVILALKPDTVLPVLAEIAPALGPAHTLISLAAGVPLDLLERACPARIPIFRVMTNLALALREAATAICANSAAGEDHRQSTAALFQPLGSVDFIDEEAMDAATALSGSGPAFVFFLLDALAEAGERAGLRRNVALRLARQTFLGAARMAEDPSFSPREWIERVATPGGTTVAGLDELERHGVRRGLAAAIEAAAGRSRELTSELTRQSRERQGL